MERAYEDHEYLVENLLMWKADSKNTLWFIKRPEVFDIFYRFGLFINYQHLKLFLVLYEANDSTSKCNCDWNAFFPHKKWNWFILHFATGLKCTFLGMPALKLEQKWMTDQGTKRFIVAFYLWFYVSNETIQIKVEICCKNLLFFSEPSLSKSISQALGLVLQRLRASYG